MLPVSDETKTLFLTDSTPKMLEINVEGETLDYEKINLYKGDLNDDVFETTSVLAQGTYYERRTSLKINKNPSTDNLLNYIDSTENLFSGKYNIVVSADVKVTNFKKCDNFGYITVSILCGRKSGSRMYISNVDYSKEYLGDDFFQGKSVRLYGSVDISSIIRNEIISADEFILVWNNVGGTSANPSIELDFDVQVSNVQVQITTASLPSLKNLDAWAVQFPYLGKYPDDDTSFTVDNNDLEVEAFSLTESLCSSDNLKFGACESSHCEFTVVNRDENFKDRYFTATIGKHISKEDKEQALLEKLSTINWYKGNNKVAGLNETQVYSYANSQLSWWMNTDTGKLTNGIRSDYYEYAHWLRFSCYLNFKVTKYTNINPAKLKMYIWFDLADGTRYAVKNGGTAEVYGTYVLDDFGDNYKRFVVNVPLSQEAASSGGWSRVFTDVVGVSALRYYLMDENGNAYSSDAGSFDYTLSVKDIVIELCPTMTMYDMHPFNEEMCLDYRGVDVDTYLYGDLPTVPLGRFKVSEVKKQHTQSVKKLQITAYDDVIKLDQNAANWYTLYMTAYSTNKYTQRYGFEVTRQIYSSYFNIAKSLGLEDRSNYTETVISEDDGGYYNIVDNSTRFFASGNNAPYVSFVAREMGILEETAKSKRMVIDLESDYTPEQVKVLMPTLFSYEPYGNGITTANIYIKEFRANGNTNVFCVNSGDYFKLSPDTTKIWIYYMYEIYDGYNNEFITRYPSHLKISRVEEPIDLTNGNIRLMYYNWSTGEIFPCDSSITGRDVVRSLLEVTGCFFKMDRYGKPTFKYCTKAGLYPRNDLYPLDTLYPRKLDGDTVPMSRYISCESDDYSVKNIGRIQIIKQQRSNETVSICEWEYIGNEKAKNTYLIDDNIFYCSDYMEYEYDSMPEVAEMLENMYNRIKSMGYTPNTTLAVGIPYLEVGDRISLLTKTGGFDAFIFRRTLKGIQALKDTYESKGDEYTEAVKDFGYKLYS